MRKSITRRRSNRRLRKEMMRVGDRGERGREYGGSGVMENKNKRYRQVRRKSIRRRRKRRCRSEIMTGGDTGESRI
jgi:hypothetical protein